MCEEGNDVPVKVPKLAMVLTAIGWFWTAYECDTIGIDVFDMLLKRFPGQVWIMAAVLTYLTIIWMPKNLKLWNQNQLANQNLLVRRMLICQVFR